MEYSILFILALLISFILIRNSGAKRLFNIPWYYRVVSLDIGRAKGRLYSYKRVNGIPDALFKHILLPIYVVGELKGRSLKQTGVRKYEFGQILLYIGIIKANHIGLIRGRLAYKDRVVNIPFDKKMFKEILGKRDKAIEVINQFQ